MHVQENISGHLQDYARAPQGFRADTWWNKDYVIQRRSREDWPRWSAVARLLASFSEDPDNILIGFPHSYELHKDSFWLRFPRQDLPGSPSRKHDLQPQERVEILERILPDMMLTSSFLEQQTPRAELVAELEDCLPLAKESVHRYSEAHIRSLAELFGYSPPLPFPSSLSHCLQHGDYSLGNTILTKHGYRLVDWESLSWQERGYDLVHLFVFVLLPQKPAEWPAITESFAPDVSSFLGISESAWRGRLYWEMLREFLFWQRGEDLRQKADWALRITAC